MLQQDADETIRLVSLPAVLDRLGRRAEADEALKAQIAQWGGRTHLLWRDTYADRGDHTTALQWLERAYEQHDSGLNEILSEPIYRTAPYRAFLRKMNLADAAARLERRSTQ